MHLKTTIISLCLPAVLLGQTYGSNSPAQGSNTIAPGGFTWANPGNITSSDNVYSTATSNTTGLTNYLKGTDFGFSLPASSVVTGIQVDIEKSLPPSSGVVLLDSWSVGPTRTLPAGNNRCLVVIIGYKNGVDGAISGVNYGGKDLLQYSGTGVFNGTYRSLSMWCLLESELQQAVGTTITVTNTSGATAESVAIVSAAVYANVNQVVPVSYEDALAGDFNASMLQLSGGISTMPGGISVTAAFSETAPSPTQALGNANAFTVANGFAETVDYHAANAAALMAGAALLVGQKNSGNVEGQDDPAVTFAGVPEYLLMMGFSLYSAREVSDFNVRLVKSGALTGTNHANFGVAWPLTDTYTTYGGASDLWGTAWSYTDINAAGFGAGIAAYISNSALQVDHMRITVYTINTLPLELISFGAGQKGTAVECNWATASERNTDKFLVERSTDGIQFETVGIVQAEGNSESALLYGFTDEHPADGVNYYRLKTIDNDGAISVSEVISVQYERGNATTVYPNPANEWASVLTPCGFDEIVITDAQGHIVDRFEGTCMQEKQDLDMSDMPDGVYFVCIRSRKGTVDIQQLVKTSGNL